MGRRGLAWIAGLSAAILWLDAASASETLSLRDNWQLQSSAKVQQKGEGISKPKYASEDWYSVRVPTTVLAALVANQVYPDPFYGDNLKRIPGYRDERWLVMPADSPFYPSWWYRTEFDAPEMFKGKHVVLHLDGINYRANVWLNGKQLADDQQVVGMFRRFEFDVTDHIEAGAANCLALEVTSPGHIPDKPYRTKQLEATTGWDDHNPQPPDLNMGVWQEVYLTATGPVAIRHPYVGTQLDVPGLDAARLTVSAYLLNMTNKEVTGTLSGAIEDIRFSQNVTLGPKEKRLVAFAPEDFAQLQVRKPRVWWPNNLGPQELYVLSLECRAADQLSDTADTRFGIRQATTYLNDEGWRQYMVNGQKVLIRGGAWMTCDMLLRLDHRRYKALVRYAKEANLNMLRSEGFSIRETEDFYSLCDEYGVMVTQQLFGRSIPDSGLAIACIEDTLLRIRNHPSLVHFLGHDETFPTKELDEAYRRMIAEYLPDRTYQPHSGAFKLEDRFKTGGTRTGSLEVWQYADPVHYYVSQDTGAWGFAQSGGIGGIFATLESMRRMMPEEALWPPWTDIWSFHTVLQGGPYFTAVLDAIRKGYGEPQNIEDLLRKGIMMNYACARGMFEAYGRNKFSATGITTWKYDAAWPASPTWQYVDWYLIPTGAYYGAKKGCEPLHVQYSYDDQTIWVVNNRCEEYKGLRVTAKVYNLDMGEKQAQTATVDVPSNDNVKALTMTWPAGLDKTFFLLLALEDQTGKQVSENFYWLSTATEADHTDLEKLPPAKLDMTYSVEKQPEEHVAHVTLKNPAEHLAFGVHLAVRQGEDGPEVAPMYWEDNYFSVLPGQEKRVSARFAPEDLAGKPPVVTVDGWNVAP